MKTRPLHLRASTTLRRLLKLAPCDAAFHRIIAEELRHREDQNSQAGMKGEKSSPYSSCSGETLARLLARAAFGSAEHRAIQDELRSRQLKLEPATDESLIFTATEWAQTEKHWCPAKSAKR
jgi:hypothetical protein